MSDYKDTLNLPKTSFSMKGNLANKEPMILNKWEKQGIYKKLESILQVVISLFFMMDLHMQMVVFMLVML